MDAVADTLFGKTRQAVLVMLFEQPSKPLYLREMAKQGKISVGALQNELNQLLSADLIIRQEDGHRVTYQANTRHPVFADLQSIVRKTCGVPAKLQAMLAPHREQIALAAIYGSFAKGGNSGASDIDLLVVGKIGLPELIALIQPLEESTGREVSVRLYSTAEFSQRKGLGDHFIQSVLSGPLIILMGSLDDA